ncbi:uroporphyrinogen-III C-methyltransferase [Ferrimonas marina]|uniref:uroporphyrinogen-III C-methyltransferase n=1 Tax=Ferrimonas marina TaxID=299255 RepID=A0A1M5X015_9GAMM|nr:uroporphyrinogen-III C-methyltransferase [Ferrimonas marina]SHH93131.1 uroporphyrin-III C-methyltransferase [Ferrimonas marina]
MGQDVITMPSQESALVWLVSAGPGDPGLLTLHAYQALQQAEVVLHDALVSDAILALIPASVELIAVGKRCGAHSMDQREIERVMIAKAHQGHRVVRLKGGDGMLFGRIGEEMAALKAAKIPYKVVPGVTAASAVSAYGAMPLTHRDLAQGVTFVTGRGKAGQAVPDWRPYVETGHTLVIYMGLKRAESVMEGLLSAGMDASTPVAIVGQASQPGQRRVVGELSQLSQLAQTPNLPTPAAMVVGEVVGLAAELDWYVPQEVEVSKSLGTSLLNAAM